MATKHLTGPEFKLINELHLNNASLRKIGLKIDKSIATIAKAIKLLKQYDNPYEAWCHRKNQRKHGGRKPLILSNEIKEFIWDCRTRLQWSLHAIKGRSDLTKNFLLPSKPTLYEMIKTDRLPKSLLIRPKGKGVNRVNSDEYPSKFRKIHERNEIYPSIEERTNFGHGEGDTIVGKQSKSNLITLTERVSRFVTVLCAQSRSATDVGNSVKEGLLKQPMDSVKTITFDQGREFAKWKTIENEKTKIYFADRSSPNQRGTNENCNRILRRFFPKSSDLSLITDQKIKEVCEIINGIPREVLGFKTASERWKEVFT